METLHVAVVGSGPAGLYTAEALIKQAAALDPPHAIRVDVLDRLPTPYGLVRYGVAPDHKSIKSIAEYLRGVLEHDGVHFVGNVHLGEDVTREDLLTAYDAVVYATGAMRDRQLGIPGEDLPGSIAATDFVNWYCGHPDMDPAAFTLDAESVAVIGVGNVAVDVARILIRNPEELRETDVSQPVLETLMASKVREVHMIGRRGPAQAKFTTKELRELGELAGVDVVVGDGEADLDAFDATGESAQLAESRPARARQLHGDQGLGGPVAVRRAPPADDPVLAAPGRDPGATRVTGLTLERTRLDERRASSGPASCETLARAAGAALSRLSERAAARSAVRRAQLTSCRTRPAGCSARTGAAARRVRGRLAQARPDRRDRDEQVRRGRDRALAARGPGRRTGPDDVQLPRAGLLKLPDVSPQGGVAAARHPGRARRPARQLRRLAGDRAGGEGTRRDAGPGGQGQAGQQRRDPPGLRPALSPRAALASGGTRRPRRRAATAPPARAPGRSALAGRAR